MKGPSAPGMPESRSSVCTRGDPAVRRFFQWLLRAAAPSRQGERLPNPDVTGTRPARSCRGRRMQDLHALVEPHSALDLVPNCSQPHAEMPVPRLQNAIVGSAIRSPAPAEITFHRRARTPNVGGRLDVQGRASNVQSAPSGRLPALRNIAVRAVITRMRARRRSTDACATARSSRCRPPRAVRDHRRADALVRRHRTRRTTPRAARREGRDGLAPSRHADRARQETLVPDHSPLTRPAAWTSSPTRYCNETIGITETRACCRLPTPVPCRQRTRSRAPG